MGSRHYSSYLLRLWFVTDDAEPNESSVTVQIQHLQSGQTWRLTSSSELGNLIDHFLSDASDLAVLEKFIKNGETKVARTNQDNA